MTHGSLFSGRGGFDIGAARAGYTNVYNCEINPWCRNELKRLFPEAEQYEDITKITTLPYTDVVSAGFPCQDVSFANTKKAKGILGQRSGLFFEVVRLVDEIRPAYIVLENSSALLVRGMRSVLAAFTKIGYMCEWHCLRASDFGYPHRRERIFIVAHPLRKGCGARVFRSLKAVALSTAWTPSETFLRAASSRANAYRDIASIPRGDGVPGNFRQEIHSLGNAVIPAIAEYIFQCIKIHYSTIQ